MTTPGREHGIVRVLVKNSVGGGHAGMGILVSPTLILTCAHVINASLGRPNNSKETINEGTRIPVAFPISDASGSSVTAKVVAWNTPNQDGGDCAMLELTKPAPVEAGVSVLSVVDKLDLSVNELSVYGCLADGHVGRHVATRFRGSVVNNWTQIAAEPGQKLGIEPGFSGAAVWDQSNQTVIGMMNQRSRFGDGQLAYFIPAATLVKQLPMFPHERRRTSPRQQAWFTRIAVLLFVLMLVHYLATQSTASLVLVPWAEKERILAAHFGMHIYAILLGPLVSFYAWRHARAYAMHPWYQRIPPLLSTRLGAASNTKDGSLGVLLFFLLLPAYAQGHFFRKVNWADASILANRTEFPASSSQFDEKHCGGAFCEHANAGVWSIIDWQPYWNHIYQIAGDNLNNAATFYPILQPAVLVCGTILAYGFLTAFFAALIVPRQVERGLDWLAATRMAEIVRQFRTMIANFIASFRKKFG